MKKIDKKDQNEPSDDNNNKYMKFVWWEIMIISILLVFVIIGPYLFSHLNWGISFNETGPIGDTIGGITAPFVNLIAAFLVYKSFTAQIQANLDQRKATRSQIISQEDQLELLRRETSANYINNIFNNTVNSFKEEKNFIDVNENQISNSFIKGVLSYLKPNSRVSKKSLDLCGHSLLMVINQLTYIIDEVNKSFSNDIDAKFYWTSQIEQQTKKFQLDLMKKIPETIIKFNDSNNKLPIEIEKLNDLNFVINVLFNKIKTNYQEFEAFKNFKRNKTLKK